MKLSISPRLEDIFARLTDGFKPPELARDVLKLSDFYIQNHGSATPWSEAYVARAYAAYFLPLNLLRLTAAFAEVHRFLRPEQIHEVWDFGSGLGALHWLLEEQEWLTPRPLNCIEVEPRAMAKHRELMADTHLQWRPEFNPGRGPGRGALAVFSYSFLEMAERLPPLEEFAHVLVVEPSFKDTGRALMKWRARWIDAGFTPLAPCTHSLACPLLTHSERDWCHNRVHVTLSPRLSELERHLPMKNHTLTYSYLLMSQNPDAPSWRGSARVIGDTLMEKGKTRQMICRGPEREFLAWLTRHGEPPRIPHGALIPDLGVFEAKSNELRVSRDLTWL